jgi:alkylhydroperoxidase/carboxymuconolactone decarboxylase family protein YurZ
LKLRKRVLGAAYVERQLRTADAFTMPMQMLATKSAWGIVWSRPGLPHRIRSMLNIAMLVALGKAEELELHLGGAIRNGVTKKEIGEILLHSAIYCGYPAALGGLARAYLASGDAERAKQTLALVPPEHQNHEAVAGVQAQLKLAELASKAGDTDALRAKVQADPSDHQARMDLAASLAARGESETAVAELLESIRRDRNWNEAAARKQLLTLFEALGAADPAVQSGRRRLSSILFS